LSFALSRHQEGSARLTRCSRPCTLGACSRSQLLEDINAQYTKADALAVYYQRRSDRLFDLFCHHGIRHGVAYLMYDKLTSSRALLIVYLVMLFTGLERITFLEGRRWFSKHLTYRRSRKLCGRVSICDWPAPITG